MCGALLCALRQASRISYRPSSLPQPTWLTAGDQPCRARLCSMPHLSSCRSDLSGVWVLWWGRDGVGELDTMLLSFFAPCFRSTCQVGGSVLTRTPQCWFAWILFFSCCCPCLPRCHKFVAP